MTTLPSRIQKLAEFEPRKLIREMFADGGSLANNDNVDGGQYENSRLRPLLEAMSECVGAYQSIATEIHDEHCDEDWHCNWCEQSMIALTRLESIVAEMEGGK